MNDEHQQASGLNLFKLRYIFTRYYTWWNVGCQFTHCKNRHACKWDDESVLKVLQKGTANITCFVVEVVCVIWQYAWCTAAFARISEVTFLDFAWVGWSRPQVDSVDSASGISCMISNWNCRILPAHQMQCLSISIPVPWTEPQEVHVSYFGITIASFSTISLLSELMFQSTSSFIFETPFTHIHPYLSHWFHHIPYLSLSIHMEVSWGFLKWGYPSIIHSTRIFPYKPTIWR